MQSASLYIKGQTYITQVSMKADDLHGASVRGDGRIMRIKRRHCPHVTLCGKVRSQLPSATLQFHTEVINDGDLISSKDERNKAVPALQLTPPV